MLSPDKITVGRIGVAYGLTPKEMWQLVDAVGAVFSYTPIPGLYYFNNLPVGRRYSHDEAYVYAKQHVESERFAKFLLSEFWEQIKFIYGLGNNDSIYDYISGGNFIITHVNDFDTAVVKGHIANELSYVLLESAIVSKANCIIYLYQCGYSIQKEVKGLNRTLIDLVTSKINTINEVYIPNNISILSIDKWNKIIPIFETKTDIHAAYLAIAKFQGMTHIEAYDTVYNERKTNVSNKSKIEHVSKAKTRVENIAKLHFLPMPEWEISKS